MVDYPNHTGLILHSFLSLIYDPAACPFELKFFGFFMGTLRSKDTYFAEFSFKSLSCSTPSGHSEEYSPMLLYYTLRTTPGPEVIKYTFQCPGCLMSSNRAGRSDVC